MSSRLLPLVAGLLLGFVAGRQAPAWRAAPEGDGAAPPALDAAPPRSPSTPPAPAAARAPATTASEDALRARHAALLEQVEAAREALEAARAEAEASRGAPLAWPRVPPAFEEVAVEQALQRLLPEEARLETLDCGEYPCVARLALGGSDALAQREAVLAALGAGPYAVLRETSTVHTDDDGEVLGVEVALALPAAPLEAGERRRVDFRLDELSASDLPAR